MDNKLTAKENYELRFDRNTAPYRVFATWNMHYACNYKCTYCHAPKPEDKDAKKAVYLKSDTWLEIWKKIYQRYGTWEILISGGEPFTYPDFVDLLIGLSKIHLAGVCTNLEWDVVHFVKRASPQRLRIETSFHPEFISLTKFIQKLGVLKKNGFNPTVNFVPWPPLLSKMEEIKEGIEKSGCQLTLQPFIGQFEGRSYPQGYTEKERQYFNIFNDECNLKTLDFKTTKASDSTRGRLCRMGQNYCFINPDGSVSRCCRDHSIPLGNITDGSFQLLEEPQECRADNCNCWRCMLVDKEDSWLKNWGRAEITELAITKHKSSVFRIALIQAPAWGIYEPPVALAQLSSCLKKDGYSVSVFDLNIEFYHRRKEEYNTVWAIEQSAFWANKDNVKKFFADNPELVEEYVNKIVDLRPDLIGFSVNVCSLPATIELVRIIKGKLPAVKISLGGAMFFVPCDIESILKNDCIEIIVQGEAEETFSELSKLLKEQKDLFSCRGIYFKKEGKIIKTEARPLIKDLDALPFLDLESFPLDKYDPPGHLGRHISLMTSRGCIMNCAYCGPKAYWEGFRFMSGKRVYDEVSYHIRNHPDIEHIEFLDLELNGNINSLTEFCDLMIKQPPKKGLRWHANIVISPQMNQELLFKMKEAGCHHVSIGIETGSQRILDLMRKKYKIEDADRVLKYAHEAGIHVTTNFMFGFPQETEDDFRLTLDFLRRNAASIGTVYPSRSFFTIEPYSYIESHMSEFGIVPNEHNNLYWESDDGKNNYPERLRRCEEFSRLALGLKVPIGLGLQTSLEQDRYYNLGFYYESKKDFHKSRDFFEEYIKLDPKNTVINKKLQELRQAEGGAVSTPHTNGRVSFNWDITSVCNYRCPYCWFYGKWVEMKKQNINIPIAALQDFWRRMHDRYGQVKISITGGEPFLYPDFIGLIITLAKWHKVDIVTNLSWPVKAMIERICSPNIKIHPSFHPLFADFGEFTDKLIILREQGLAENPSYVAWPPQIPTLKYYAGKFKKYGIEMFVQSFFGEYKGVKYPEGYSDEEKEIIISYLGERGGEPFQTEKIRTKRKLCYAGCLYGVIHPDGDVLRCGGLDSQDAKVGNLLESNFQLHSEAYPCTAEVCPCNEWALLLKKDE
jgi:radical SAM superfamily enzyme YgiQ (UPF0313 family)/organic radical activating enzyme